MAGSISSKSSSLFGARGTIVEVCDAKQAKQAQNAGACAVTLGLVRDYNISRARSNVSHIKKSISIPLMVTCRIGHRGEARILEAISGRGIDYIQEAYVPNAPVDIDDGPYIDKHSFKIPFVCVCKNLKEALKRVNEGASLLRIQGPLQDPHKNNAIGPTSKAVIKVMKEISNLNDMDESELKAFADEISVPYDLVQKTKKLGRLPVPQFASSGIRSFADAVMMMELGLDGVFLERNAHPDYLSAMVKVVKHYDDPKLLSTLH